MQLDALTKAQWGRRVFASCLIIWVFRNVVRRMAGRSRWSSG